MPAKPTQRRPVYCQHQHRSAVEPTPGELARIIDELVREIGELERALAGDEKAALVTFPATRRDS